MTAPPRFSGVLETVVYASDLERVEPFYTETLGMRVVGKEPGRSLFLRAGGSVFLVFDPEATERSEGLPPHGARGPGHVCFLVDAGDYDRWKEHVAARGVEIVQEAEWTNGRSFYFRDPAGNLLEIADADIWPR